MFSYLTNALHRENHISVLFTLITRFIHKKEKSTALAKFKSLGVIQTKFIFKQQGAARVTFGIPEENPY